MRGNLPRERRHHQGEPHRLEGREVEAAERQLDGTAEQRREEGRGQEDQEQQQAEREPAVQQLDERAEHELHVEDHGAVADVEDVVAELVARMREVATAELGEPRHARPDDEAGGVVLDLAHGRREEHRSDRPRPDEIHVSAEDVQKLRDLVELRALEKPPDRRVERIARRQEARADALLRIHQQGAELEDAERLHVPPDARARVEDGAAARELRRERDGQRDRQGEQ